MLNYYVKYVKNYRLYRVNNNLKTVHQYHIIPIYIITIINTSKMPIHKFFNFLIDSRNLC